MVEEPTPVDDATSAEEEDELERLRRKSTLASSVYDDLDVEGESSTNPLSRLSGPQVIILAGLAIIDVIAIVVVGLIIAGVI